MRNTRTEAWGDGDKDESLALQVKSVLEVDHGEGRLGNRVWGVGGELDLLGEISVPNGGRDVDNFLGGALLQQGEEGIDGEDSPDNVDVELRGSGGSQLGVKAQ